MAPEDPRRRANRSLIRGLLLMTLGSFAFGWALVPLYSVFCRLAGLGNAEAKAVQSVATEAPDLNRVVATRPRTAASSSARTRGRCGSTPASSTTRTSTPAT